MDDVYRIAPMANGVEVKVRPVSPHVRQGLYLRVKEALPPKPEMPVKKLQSVDGHTEPAPAEEGDPEYEAWKKDFAAWRSEADKIKGPIDQDNMLRLMVYAVLAWRRPLGAFLQLLRAVFHANWFWNIFGLGWQTQPPKGWKPNPIIRIPDGMTTRDVFIITEIISDVQDYRMIDMVATPIAREPITQEEVGRQLDGFLFDG